MNTLRFITAGNVDDGKSTLIGRLLYDSDSIHTDQLGVLQKQTKQEGVDIDLSLITDGLRAEREQGITIDVAYKYFSTSKRKFIIADAPGHEQYTRNMITGASNSDLIIILVDARKGITEQTKRHASVGSLMGIKKAIIAINKIDLVNYSESVFNQIQSDFEQIKSELHYNEIIYIPVSALVGDNVVNTSENTPWYNGKSILETLESIEVETAESLESRFQVQWVIRPKDEANHDYRGYAGPVLSGSYKVGDNVTILPARIETTIVKIERNQEEVNHVVAGDNVVLHFDNNIDISRGDTVVLSQELPTESSLIKTWISWLDNASLQVGKTYLLQHRFKNVRVKVQEVNNKWNINQWQFTEGDSIQLNDIAQVTLKTNQPLFYDAFDKNAKSGNAILIDETSYNTVGALMFL
ncbi:sulfate adenylyltransferase [Flavobacterium covae]|uniref:sulfate adenylyltransferase n=1 Tax=Flavobacterium covae TaxID=2906076 RepID=A0ABW8PDB3_9FLAO|nr:MULTISPECIES: GTP-binding protein [Flavobacterium]OXA83554.1 sulfate adenylyltransferase [Flavobacterium columnare NBRC 100251 = ATCC 23463]AND64414.1 sulfate adenylyltransferase [Flavobacterium covae]OWP81930.1 sulfate adenylyltransferase [Flavobacterium covae]OWP87389.1 sulfate adenylyltransferase [Flavobacterium covae]POR23272.1 sulfate adenylyltransferase [Flavobacterium columnare]